MVPTPQQAAGDTACGLGVAAFFPEALHTSADLGWGPRQVGQSGQGGMHALLPKVEKHSGRSQRHGRWNTAGVLLAGCLPLSVAGL